MTRRPVTATLPVSQVERLDAVADATGVSRSALLALAVEKYLSPSRTRRRAR